MMKKIVRLLLLTMLILGVFCVSEVKSDAAQIEETSEDTAHLSPLNFEVAIFTYEIKEDATQADMPKGFVLGDWEYHGVAVKAGFTENSDMVCVMGEDVETGYTYRFISGLILRMVIFIQFQCMKMPKCHMDSWNRIS